MYGKISQSGSCFFINSVNSAIIRNIDSTFDYPGDMHNYWEMVYVMKGNATVTEDENVYLMPEGSVIFHRPMEFHKLYVQGTRGSVAKIMILSFDCDSDALDCLGEGIFRLDRECAKLVRDLYKTITEIYEGAQEKASNEHTGEAGVKNLDEMIAFSKVSLILLTLAKKLFPVQSEEAQTKMSSAVRGYKRIMEILNHHIYEDLSVGQIASLACMSKSNVQKLFKTYSGCGVMQQFNRIKVAVAMDFIKEGMNINEISSRLAYSSPNYFSEVFKREVGVLPSHFKQQLQSFAKQSGRNAK